jgi:Tfp pilus assembly protein PilO
LYTGAGVMDLKNMNMSDLKGKLGAIDKKTLIKFGIGFGAIILFLIVYYVILNPMVKERKAKYADKLLKENEITQFSNDIIIYKKKLKKIKPEFEKTSTLFHSKAEVEDLYQSLSRYAAVNGLVISKIEKKKPKAVLKSGIASQAENQIKKDMVSYYKIPVDYEIKGNFLGYIKFKRAISKSKKMLNFDKEIISVVQNDSTGAIVARGELTIVGLPNEFF